MYIFCKKVYISRSFRDFRKDLLFCTRNMDKQNSITIARLTALYVNTRRQLHWYWVWISILAESFCRGESELAKTFSVSILFVVVFLFFLLRLPCFVLQLRSHCIFLPLSLMSHVSLCVYVCVCQCAFCCIRQGCLSRHLALLWSPLAFVDVKSPDTERTPLT